MDLAQQAFQYSSLEHQSFRLLKVPKVRSADRSIVGQLHPYSLWSQDLPQFAAVSYVWGENIRDSIITLDGQSFPVLKNVYHFLEAIHENEHVASREWFWIDSICINNSDVVERAAQVQLMDQIFRNSYMTVVWLGPKTVRSDMGMEFFLTLADARDKLDHVWQHTHTRQVPSRLNIPERWEALADILQGPWWRRAWTMQEYILPSTAVFLHGSKSMSDVQFRKAMYSIFCCKPGRRLIKGNTQNAAWNRRRIRQWRDGLQQSPLKMSLVALLAYTGDCFLYDPRDRIYACLGLANGPDRIVVGQPIYDGGVSAGTVYANVVSSFIQIYKSLDIICFATLFNLSNKIPEQNAQQITVPSWVPNWNIRVHVFVTPLLVSQSGVSYIGNFRPIHSRADTDAPALYDAAGNTEPDYSFLKSSKQMRCRGIILDSVDGLGSTGVTQGDDELDQHDLDVVPSASYSNRAIASFSDPVQRNQRSRRLLDKIIRSMVLDRQDRYLSTRAPLDRFRVELAHLIASKDSNKGRSAYQNFYSWLDNNKTLQFRGFRLEELFQSAVLFTVPPNLSLSEQSKDSLPSRLNDTTDPRKMRKRLMVTVQGSVGMAPWHARRGDIVCVLYGCRVPVLLRPQEQGYMFIGECYADGLMNGEIFDRDLESQDFVLQ